MVGNIPRNVRLHSPECSAAFTGMLCYIPRNIWLFSPECLAIFPRMFEDIPRTPEYNIPSIPRVPRIPFLVPVFLVLYIAN